MEAYRDPSRNPFLRTDALRGNDIRSRTASGTSNHGRAGNPPSSARSSGNSSAVCGTTECHEIQQATTFFNPNNQIVPQSVRLSQNSTATLGDRDSIFSQNHHKYQHGSPDTSFESNASSNMPPRKNTFESSFQSQSSFMPPSVPNRNPGRVITPNNQYHGPQQIHPDYPAPLRKLEHPNVQGFNLNAAMQQQNERHKVASQWDAHSSTSSQGGLYMKQGKAVPATTQPQPSARFPDIVTTNLRHQSQPGASAGSFSGSELWDSKNHSRSAQDIRHMQEQAEQAEYQQLRQDLGQRYQQYNPVVHGKELDAVAREYPEKTKTRPSGRQSNATRPSADGGVAMEKASEVLLFFAKVSAACDELNETITNMLSKNPTRKQKVALPKMLYEMHVLDKSFISLIKGLTAAALNGQQGIPTPFAGLDLGRVEFTYKGMGKKMYDLALRFGGISRHSDLRNKCANLVFRGDYMGKGEQVDLEFVTVLTKIMRDFRHANLSVDRYLGRPENDAKLSVPWSAISRFVIPCSAWKIVVEEDRVLPEQVNFANGQ